MGWSTMAVATNTACVKRVSACLRLASRLVHLSSPTIARLFDTLMVLPRSSQSQLSTSPKVFCPKALLGDVTPSLLAHVILVVTATSTKAPAASATNGLV